MIDRLEVRYLRSIEDTYVLKFLIRKEVVICLLQHDPQM